MNVKFFFLNILKTKCNSVRKGVINALSCTLWCLVFIKFKKKNFTFIKSTCLNNECTHIKKGIFYRKVFKLQHYSSVTLHVSTKNPISEVKKKIPSKINPNCASTFFSYTFFKVFHENSAQTDVSKVMWVSILKGLKHLNTVLNWSLRLRFTGYYIIICTYIRCWEHRPCFNEKYIHKLQS